MCISPMMGAADDFEKLLEVEGIQTLSNKTAPVVVGVAISKATGQPVVGLAAKEATERFARDHPKALVRPMTTLLLVTVGPVVGTIGALALPFVAAKAGFDALVSRG